jgi:beta-glucosidase
MRAIAPFGSGRCWPLGIALALGLAACGADSPSAETPVTPPHDVEALLAQMTLDEKVGQMTQAERGNLSPETEIRDLFLGSVLSGGGSSPADSRAGGWADMCDRFQAFARETRLQIPILYGADAVHGHNNVRDAVIFPHNIGLGCTRNPPLVEQVARITALEAAATGVNWTFSPCLAVPRDERWGRSYEGFGETPELVSELATAAVVGYQSRILACAKHYLADGGTSGGRDQGDAQMDEATLRAIHLPSYRAAVGAGVGSVMVSFSSWNGQKMHANRHLITDVLKGELAFAGFVVTDWAAVDQLSGSYATQIETAVNAGIDMIMEPYRHRECIAVLRAAANAGRIPLARIDDAVRRILRQKVARGLFEQPLADRSLLPQVGSAEHRAVARDAVRQSLVLLRNERGVLPLSKTAPRIHVAGKNADDLGNQCGGWTITWQGSSGRPTTGTTILQAIQATVAAGTQVTWTRDGSGAAGASAAVVVIGERPYAEGLGDRSDLSLEAEDVASVRRVAQSGVPTVVVLVSGRPMIIDDVLADADALLAAWLPGTEGQGVADVLFGDYRPTGRLSRTWPRSMSQIPINWGDASYDPLFPYGFGLTY